MNKFTFISGWAFKPEVFEDIITLLPADEIQLIDLCDFDVNTFNASSRQDKHILIGWSLGCLTALQLCNLHPQHFTHLILLSGTPRFKQDQNWGGINEVQIQKQLASAETDISRYLRQFMRLACYPEKSLDNANKYLHSTKETSLQYLLQTLFHSDLREQFKNINIPIMQIIAENDRVVLPTQSLQSKSLIANTIHSIPNAGHLSLITHASQIATLIKEFTC